MSGHIVVVEHDNIMSFYMVNTEIVLFHRLHKRLNCDRTFLGIVKKVIDFVKDHLTLGTVTEADILEFKICQGVTRRLGERGVHDQLAKILYHRNPKTLEQILQCPRRSSQLLLLARLIFS